MQTGSLAPNVKHLVLVGGGHSHLFVLKRLGMRPVPGLSVTLISTEIETPYSGLLPSFISGFCSQDDMHIDLRPLSQFAGARVIKARVSDIDLDSKVISLAGRPAIPFDLLSINTGSQPNASLIHGAAEHACAVKPISHFLARWSDVCATAVQHLNSNKPYSIVLVGGGPASIELALAMQYRIHTDCGIPLSKPSPLSLTLISSAEEILPQHSVRVRQLARKTLTQRHIKIETAQRVKRFLPDAVQTESGGDFYSDAAFYATGASLPTWPASCGLAISEDGFIDTLPTLQTASHQFVFAAGDAASLRGFNRPKSGVYAVRAGQVLVENLVRFATGAKLKTFSPQQRALALISLGDKRAIASRGSAVFQGRMIWSLKQRIDARFVARFSQLPAMPSSIDLTPGLIDKEAEATLRNHAMRCAGCGAKVASGILEEVLDDLSDSTGSVRKPVEDASIVTLEDGRLLLQSIDQLSAFINDPWLFAQIATNHCLSDIYAMGAQPHSALAVVGLPMASREMTKRALAELMRGCQHALAANDCELLGGHTAENPQLQLGLAVNAFSSADALLSKSGMRRGDVLILTKPLGTGTLLAADMRSRGRSVWIEPALEQMLLSNSAAATAFRHHGATACTDITGFGLAGHLVEMIEPCGAEVELSLNAIPALDGSLELLAEGLRSSLHSSNRRLASVIFNQEAFGKNPRFELLFDPQTAGGLLAAVPEHSADACLDELRRTGHPTAATIGRVTNTALPLASIILK